MRPTIGVAKATSSFVVSGGVLIEHSDGRRYELSEGMSYHVPDDEAAPHRLTSNEGASVFIVD